MDDLAIRFASRLNAGESAAGESSFLKPIFRFKGVLVVKPCRSGVEGGGGGLDAKGSLSSKKDAPPTTDMSSCSPTSVVTSESARCFPERFPPPSESPFDSRTNMISSESELGGERRALGDRVLARGTFSPLEIAIVSRVF